MADDYTGIFNVVRAKLRMSEDKLPDDDETLVDDTETLVALLLPRVPCLGSTYAGIPADKKQLFDKAVGRLVAAHLRPTLIAADNDGAGVVVEEQDGDSKTKYSGPNALLGSQKMSLEELWTAEAERLLEQLCKSDRRRPASSGSFVAAPGRRRREEAATGYRAVDARELLLPTVGRRRR